MELKTNQSKIFIKKNPGLLETGVFYIRKYL